LGERTTQVLAAAAAVGMDADTGFDIAVGEDGTELVEEFAGRAADWQEGLVAVAAAADGGEQVDWKTLAWIPEAGAGGDGDGLGRVQGVGYVVDVESGAEVGEEVAAEIV
jgi:hypothetical protein